MGFHCRLLSMETKKEYPIRHFTSTLVVMSHKINACFVYVSQAYFFNVCVSMTLSLRDQWNAKNADMEQALLLCNITTKVLVKCHIEINIPSWLLTHSTWSGHKYTSTATSHSDVQRIESLWTVRHYVITRRLYFMASVFFKTTVH